MPNSTDIDEAIVTRLSDDPALQALVPDGVFFDEAPPGLRQFVTVSLVSEKDDAEFGQRASEDAVYRVLVNVLDIGSARANSAAGRIDALLEDQELVVPEYSWMTTYRQSRLRTTLIDADDTTLRWQQRGGTYRVQMAPIWPAEAGKEQTP